MDVQGIERDQAHAGRVVRELLRWVLRSLSEGAAVRKHVWKKWEDHAQRSVAWCGRGIEEGAEHGTKRYLREADCLTCLKELGFWARQNTLEWAEIAEKATNEHLRLSRSRTRAELMQARRQILKARRQR